LSLLLEMESASERDDNGQVDRALSVHKGPWPIRDRSRLPANRASRPIRRKIDRLCDQLLASFENVRNRQVHVRDDPCAHANDLPIDSDPVKSGTVPILDNQFHYLPLTAGSFSILVFLAVALVILIQLRILGYAYRRQGVGPRAAFLLSCSAH
jgi:hypothetical protein